VVIQEHNRDLDALLDHGGDLAIHHQVRAIAHHHVDLARGIRQLDAQAPGDLIPHARVAVFQVVAFRIAGSPQLVQIPGQAAGGTDDHVLRARKPIDDTDDFALADRDAVLQGVDALYLGIPFAVKRRC